MSIVPSESMEGDNNEVEKKEKPSCSTRFKTSMHNAGRFIFNRDTKEVLGRTGLSWVKILSFYIVFYAFLAGFWTACMVAFIRTLDPVQPTMQKMYSMMKDNPGMNYEPFTDTSATRISFNPNNTESDNYKAYVSRLNDIYSEYLSKAIDSTQKNCSNGDGATLDLPCRFDINMLGSNCTPDTKFGYSIGRPCVLLRINKIFLWQPNGVTFDVEGNCSGQTTDECKKQNEFLSLPKAMRSDIKPGFISVSCEGENEGDRDNIKSVSFYPSGGFPAYFYPYYNQPGYTSPPVMAQFDVFPGRKTLIFCKVWTRDIIHNKIDLQGSIRFELLVEQ